VCGPKGSDFLSRLVTNGVSILATFVLNRIWFLHSSLEFGVFFRRSLLFIIIDKTIDKKTFTIPVTSV